MNANENSNFFDRSTLTAMVILAVLLFGWYRYQAQKYPEHFAKKAAVTTPAAPTTPGVAAVKPAVDTASPAALKPSSSTSLTESFTHVTTDSMAFDVSNKGMGLRNFKLVQYTDRRGQTVDMGVTANPQSLFETRLLGQADAVDFKIEKQNDLMYVGHAQVGGVHLVKTMEIVPDKYLLKYKVAASGSDPKFTGLTTTLLEQLDSPTKGNLLLPQLEKQEFFVQTAEKNERTNFKKENLDVSWSKVKLASIGSQYFTEAIIDSSPVMPEVKAELNHENDQASMLLKYAVLNPGQEFQLDYQAYVGPKSYSLLRAIDPTLASVVDFGFFNFIARNIFDLLKYFYSLVGNWGLAIICLTLVVRACLLPFNVYSYKSMRAMQAIQPKIAAVKERFKDDQQKANGEVMKLMRENKVNPLGGCLPILLQFPVFFALYQMLGHTIELYQAPFGLWIHDLSLKDPYYVLPVLMGITMFIQQKTTPNASMDPNQQKILMMMPLIFTFFMISLPSGLALYMLVGAVFSVLQQTYFMKTHKTQAIVAN